MPHKCILCLITLKQGLIKVLFIGNGVFIVQSRHHMLDDVSMALSFATLPCRCGNEEASVNALQLHQPLFGPKFACRINVDFLRISSP